MSLQVYIDSLAMAQAELATKAVQTAVEAERKEYAIATADTIPPRLRNSVFLDNYDQSAILYECVHVIAQTAGSAHFRIWDGKKDVTNSKRYDFFRFPRIGVNANQLWFDFWTSMELTGEAFWEKVRDRNGRITGLVKLRSDKMTILPHNTKWIGGFELKDGLKKPIPYRTRDVFYTYYPDPQSHFRGLSPAAAVWEEVVTDKRMGNYNKQFFEGGARLQGIIQSKRSMPSDQEVNRIQSMFAKVFGMNVRNMVPRTPVMPPNFEWKEMAVKHAEMEYLKGREYISAKVAGAYQIPKAFVPSLRNTHDINRAQADYDARYFLFQNIQPRLESCEVAINADPHLIEEGHRFEFQLGSMPLMLEYILNSALKFVQPIQTALMTRNEARAMMRLPIVEDERADMLIDSTGEQFGIAPRPEEKPGSGTDPEADKSILKARTDASTRKLYDLATILQLGSNGSG